MTHMKSEKMPKQRLNICICEGKMKFLKRSQEREGLELEMHSSLQYGKFLS